ncbi:28S ribosomal protein S29, mitochondrial-like [Pomacea canaliculata]|uniref:28S ribosomal protein S29, mitochondrial-like n=1 Tax=Pomacea canaliculata TaxID=400727 RepID=UPI000D730D99|nr:28S ribosomal protein S29, mitochondrial-like [Pomacea canaliculata]
MDSFTSVRAARTAISFFKSASLRQCALGTATLPESRYLSTVAVSKQTTQCCHHGHKIQLKFRCVTSLAEQFQEAYSAKQKTTNFLSLFRTEESEPARQSMDQEGMFYTVAEADVKQVFEKGLPLHFTRQSKTFNETCFMVRRPALQVIEHLKNLNLEHPVPRFVLYGKRGSGKSLTIAHVLHFCFQEKWLLVHVALAPEFNRKQQEISPSSHKPGRMDLPVEAADWLVHFRNQNLPFLKDIKTSQKYVWSKREATEEGSSLLELIEFGLNRMKFSSDCVGAILKEIRTQAAVRKLKVLVAVDGVNAFWNRTGIKTPEREMLMAGQISLVHNFKKMLLSNWTSGAVLCSVDISAKPLQSREQHTPRYLLGKEGFEWFDPFIPIHVPDYNDKEAYSCLEYYLDRHWIQHEGAQTEEGKKELLFLSNKNPFQLLQICSSK